MKPTHFVLALSLMVALSAVELFAQSSRHVTVVTQKGDVIEGTLKSATELEVFVEVAGQSLRVPLEAIRYLSFVGKLDGAPSTGTDSSKPIDVALKNLNELRAAGRVGILRPQYSEKLVALLPQVMAFTESGPADDWSDVKTAVRFAAARYKAPMMSLESWSTAGSDMSAASVWLDYAEALIGQKNEETHIEKPGEQVISVGSEVTGRLGNGDAVMSKTLDESSARGLNDIWSLELKIPSRITIEMTASPCSPHLVLTDESGKKLDSDGPGGKVSIHKSLPAGRYQIWAGSFAGRLGPQVGTYKLSVRPQ